MRPLPVLSSPLPLGPNLAPGLQLALGLLLRARDVAQELQRDVWDFAVSRRDLQAAGLTDTDLRWLLCQGHVEHAVERTKATDKRRSFQRTVNLALSERSCFVLAQTGADLLRQQFNGNGHSSGGRPRANKTAVVENDRPHTEVPSWEAKQHTLYWRGKLVKLFKHDAPCQEAILSAFQARGWAACTRIRLPRDSGMSPKERLRETIKNLNVTLRGYLRFHQEGNGSRVRWEAVE